MTTVEEYFKDKDADFFNNREKLMEGVEFCNNYLNKYGDNTKAYYWKGFCYSCLNINIEKALYSFNKAIELNSNDAQLYLMRGNCYRTLKQYKNAIEDYKKGIELETSHSTHSSMISGFKHNLTGILLEIRKICDEHYNTAGEYMQDEDWDSAIEELSVAIEEYSAIDCIKDEDYFKEIDKESSIWKGSIFQDIALAYDVRASLYEELEEYQKALSDMNEAVKICPKGKKNGYFRINRAEVNRKMGNYEKTISDLSIAIDLYNKNDDDEFDWTGQNKKYLIRSYGSIAWCYQQLKQYRKAIENYTNLIDLCDEEDNLCFNAYRDRIDCYIEIKDYNSAKSDCEYLLDNEEIFEPYAEYDTFSNIESVYQQLEQFTQDYDDEGNDYDKDDNSDKMKEYLEKFSAHISNEEPAKAIVEFYKAYIHNKVMLSDFVNYILQHEELSPGYKNMYISMLDFCKKSDDFDMSQEEILQSLIEKAEKRNSINISALHHDPKKGRKLDL